MGNRLQAVASTLSTWIGRVEAVFAEFDFVGHQLSGSGSAYFGVLPQRAAGPAAGVDPQNAAVGSFTLHAVAARFRDFARRTAVEITEVRIKLNGRTGRAS